MKTSKPKFSVPSRNPVSPTDLRAYAMWRTPVDVLDFINRLHLDFKNVFELEPRFSAAFKEHVEKTDRELLWRMEQFFRLYPEAMEEKGAGHNIQRVAAVTTGLALTTHFLRLLKYDFKRARARIKRKEARAKLRSVS